MHRQFRKHLANARGESRNVVAVFFDIRGFTSFNTKVDAVDSASYIKRVYQKVIDEYFPDASFFKPTGDGLMIIYDYDANTVQTTLRSVVDSCLRLGAQFKDIAAGDPMVNFAVPDRAGFGIARGSACCLVSGKMILDYSGRQLNLAARLLDLARPQGVVMDGAVGIELLAAETQKLFDSTTAVIRGIADRAPGAPVYLTRNLTKIPDSARVSLDEGPPIVQRLDFKSLNEMADAGRFRIRLNTKPRNPATIQVTAVHPKVAKGGKRHPTLRSRRALSASEFSYSSTGGQPYVVVKLPAVAEEMKGRGVRQTWPTAIEIEYEGI